MKRISIWIIIMLFTALVVCSGKNDTELEGITQPEEIILIENIAELTTAMPMTKGSIGAGLQECSLTMTKQSEAART